MIEFKQSCQVELVELRLFRDLQKPTRFDGGGGVVADFLRDLKKPTRFSGGGFDPTLSVIRG